MTKNSCTLGNAIPPPRRSQVCGVAQIPEFATIETGAARPHARRPHSDCAERTTTERSATVRLRSPEVAVPARYSTLSAIKAALSVGDCRASLRTRGWTCNPIAIAQICSHQQDRATSRFGFTRRRLTAPNVTADGSLTLHDQDGGDEDDRLRSTPSQSNVPAP
jgi:hypothetical protein